MAQMLAVFPTCYSLEPRGFERVEKKLTRVKLRPKEFVYRTNGPIDHVHRVQGGLTINDPNRV